LELTYDQFVDLCILCGCDYCSTIKGIGPKTALKLVKQHKTLEAIIEHLRKDKKYDIPADWRLQKISKKVLQSVEEEEAKAEELAEAEALAAMNADPETVTVDATEGAEAAVETVSESVNDNVVTEIVVDSLPAESSATAVDDEKIETEHSGTSPEEEDIVVEGGAGDDDEYEIIPPLYVQARGLFVVADVHNADDIELKWTEPDEEGLRTFLCDRMGFSVERVNSGIKRLKEANAQKSQKRMDRWEEQSLRHHLLCVF
jgi:5'-3' exonuclease